MMIREHSWSHERCPVSGKFAVSTKQTAEVKQEMFDEEHESTHTHTHRQLISSNAEGLLPCYRRTTNQSLVDNVLNEK